MLKKKMLASYVSHVSLQQGNVKNSEKLMEIVNIEGRKIHIF